MIGTSLPDVNSNNDNQTGAESPKPTIHPVARPIGHPALWFFLGWVGTMCLLLNPYTLSLFTINCIFAGGVFLSAAGVGLSTHLSAFIQKPHYNLWEKCKMVAHANPIAVAIASISLTLFNPVITLIGTFIGLTIQESYPESKASFIAFCEQSYNVLQRFISGPRRSAAKRPSGVSEKKSIPTHSQPAITDLPQDKPKVQSISSQNNNTYPMLRRIISTLSGLVAGMILYSQVVHPFVYPFISLFNSSIAGFFSSIGNWFVSLLPAGVVPHYILAGMGLTLNGLTVAFFPLLSVAGTTAGFYLLGEALSKLSGYLGDKIVINARKLHALPLVQFMLYADYINAVKTHPGRTMSLLFGASVGALTYIYFLPMIFPSIVDLPLLLLTSSGTALISYHTWEQFREVIQPVVQKAIEIVINFKNTMAAIFHMFMEEITSLKNKLIAISLTGWQKVIDMKNGFNSIIQNGWQKIINMKNGISFTLSMGWQKIIDLKNKCLSIVVRHTIGEREHKNDDKSSISLSDDSSSEEALQPLEENQSLIFSTENKAEALKDKIEEKEVPSLRTGILL